VGLTPELKELFDSWVNLSAKQKKALMVMIDAMKNENV